MNTYFLDSSALAKRYITEIGSGRLRQPVKSGCIIVVARITWVEVISALSRLKREGKITEEDMKEMIELFQNDWDSRNQIVEIDKTVIDKN